MREIPRRLQKERFGFVKLKPRIKIPFEKGWQKNPYSYKDIQQWVEKNNNNYGVLGGHGGLIVIDADAPQISAIVKEHLPATFTVKTSGGFHYYFFCKDIKKKIVFKKGKDHFGEIISHGSQVAGAGSIHPDTGMEYQLENDIEIAEASGEQILSEFKEYLPVAGKEKESAATGTTAVTEGSRNDTLTSLAGSMHRKGLTPAAILAAAQKQNEGYLPPLEKKEVEKIVKSVTGYPREGGTSELNAFTFTEWGNAEAIAALFADRLKYDHRQGRWLLWQEHWWKEDIELYRRELASEMVSARIKAATGIAGDDERKRAISFMMKSWSERVINASLSLARSKRGITDPGDSWDTDPYLIGVANGVVDLRTGKLRPGCPGDRITRHIDIAFDPSAECPTWINFLDAVFQSDRALIDYMHKSIGYTLSGLNKEQAFFFLHGKGWNGKTTMLETMLHIFGPYGHNTDFSTFLSGRYGDSHPTELAELAGKRLVVAQEPDESKSLNAARLKALAGGDKGRARFLHQRGFSWDRTEKVWLAANHKPVVRDPTAGFWRKIRFVLFEAEFKGSKCDRDLPDKLKIEAPGILAWIVRGALRWQSEGLPTPGKIEKATEEYRLESDPVGKFLEECCDIKDGLWVGTRPLRTAWNQWAKENNERLTLREFWGRLKMRGCEPKRKLHAGKQARGWEGIGLVEEGDSEESLD